MPHSSLLRRLRKFHALVGLLQMRLNPLLVEMASECGYDFLIVDEEHGIFSDSDYAQTMSALAASDVLAMVRLSSQDPHAAARHLEAGADVIIVPHVSTPEEAHAFTKTLDSHPQASLIVIIESILGVAHAEKILTVEGVEGALVGPSDLSADLGIQGEYTHPDYREALLQIEGAARLTKKILGTVPHGIYSLEMLMTRGHSLFVLGTDQSLLHDAMTAQVAKARSSLLPPIA